MFGYQLIRTARGLAWVKTMIIQRVDCYHQLNIKVYSMLPFGTLQSVDIVPSSQAVVEGRRNLQHVIAENFTRPDGSTDLYVGRGYIMPAMAAWPIPHDAPYRPQIERCMMAVIEVSCLIRR